MIDEKYLRQLGIGVASLTFGVALAVFAQAVFLGIINSMQALVLFVASFLLMLRFWWRYTTLFVQFLPSRSYWHFLCDFLISFFGILAVLFVSNIQTWALLGALAMVFSFVRCSLSWGEAKDGDVKKALKRTVIGALVVFLVMVLIYLFAPFFGLV